MTKRGGIDIFLLLAQLLYNQGMPESQTAVSCLNLEHIWSLQNENITFSALYTTSG